MGWSKTFVEWIVGTTAYISVVFSWDLPKAYQRAVWLARQGYRVQAGGPAVIIKPSYLQDVAEIGGQVDALQHHNPDATFTSRGCIRRCPFCAVPKIEGDLVELGDWPVKPIVCDNNLLACSRVHFDRVIDRLKPLHNVDFNQGLDARLLTAHHAQRLAELDLLYVRLAWDNVNDEEQFMRAFDLVTAAGIAPSRVRVYVLIGFNDTPDDALYRMETVRKLKALPNPMRYQPLDSLKRNAHIGSNWKGTELQRFTRYWSRLRFLSHIPFAEFR